MVIYCSIDLDQMVLPPSHSSLYNNNAFIGGMLDDISSSKLTISDGSPTVFSATFHGSPVLFGKSEPETVFFPYEIWGVPAKFPNETNPMKDSSEWNSYPNLMEK